MQVFFALLYVNFAIEKNLAQLFYLIFDKNLEVGLYSAVLSFCLAFSLGVKSGRKPPLDFQEVT